MSLSIILEIILFGLALSADAMSVAISEGLTFVDIDKKKALFIAFVFGFCQGLFPLIGYWLIEGASFVLVNGLTSKISTIISTTISWVASLLLIYIGVKMIIDVLKELKEEKTIKITYFSYRTVLIMGIVTAIDALSSGIAFHNSSYNGVALSNNYTIWLHVAIIMVITFALSLVGVLCGTFFNKLFKGRYEVVKIIGGAILILLGIWILLSHYLKIM